MIPVKVTVVFDYSVCGACGLTVYHVADEAGRLDVECAAVLFCTRG